MTLECIPKYRNKSSDVRTLEEFMVFHERLILEVFVGNTDKAKEWLLAPNLNFGGSTPKDLIENGRGYKVEFWLLSIIGE